MFKGQKYLQETCIALHCSLVYFYSSQVTAVSGGRGKDSKCYIATVFILFTTLNQQNTPLTRLWMRRFKYEGYEDR